MNKICKNCGASNTEHAHFCAKCGDPLRSHESQHKEKERTPAEQADEMWAEADKFAAKTKHIWENLTQNEKIMAVGALGGLVAFALPLVSVGGQSINGFTAGSNSIYAYLYPLLMIVSLVLLYFTQGMSDTRKALTTRWQIIIGSVSSTVGVSMVFFISTLGNLFSQLMGGISALFGGNSFSVSAGIGAYLFAGGAVAIAVGAFRLQSQLLRHHRKENG